MNRHAIKKWFITFPKCPSDLPKDYILDLIPSEIIKSASTARELHADGTPHYHSIVILIGKGLTKKKMLEFITLKYPDHYKRIHLTSIRNLGDTIDYIRKEDPDPWHYGMPLLPKPRTIIDDIEETNVYAQLARFAIENGITL